MNQITVAKIAFTVVGIALFLFGVRVDEAVYRWAGIAFVAVAFALRFLPGGASRR